MGGDLHRQATARQSDGDAYPQPHTMLTLLDTILARIGELQPRIAHNGGMDTDIQPQ